MTKRNDFTLLEVLVAMVILTLGAGGLLWQLALAANRAGHNARTWALTHDLTAAAEWLLLYGQDGRLDDTLFTGEWQISGRFELPQRLPENTETLFGTRRLRTLVVEARRDGAVLDSWQLDCWQEERSHAQR